MSICFGSFAKSRSITPSQLSRAWAQAMAFDFREHFGCRYHMIHAKSLDAAPYFATHSLDVIFIDGLHTYEGTLADIRAWWPKLSPDGGLMIFNDYGSKGFPGVKRAVQTFMRPFKLTAKVGKHGVPPGHRNAYVVRWPGLADS